MDVRFRALDRSRSALIRNDDIPAPVASSIPEPAPLPHNESESVITQAAVTESEQASKEWVPVTYPPGSPKLVPMVNPFESRPELRAQWDGTRDQGYHAAAKAQRPWIQEEILADRARIRQRLIVAVVASILTDIAIFDLNRRLFPLAFATEAILVPLAAVSEAASKIRKELRQRVEIEANLPLEIEKLALYLGSGLSLNSSFYRIAKTSSKGSRPEEIHLQHRLFNLVLYDKEDDQEGYATY